MGAARSTFVRRTAPGPEWRTAPGPEWRTAPGPEWRTAPGPEWRTAPGPVAYPDAIGAMQERAAAIRAGTAGELAWLLEHPPLYAAGTSARAEDLTDPERFPTFAAGRGGQWTYHGPGQRVAYVLLDLARPHGRVRARDVRSYVAGLEAWVIGALARLGVEAGLVDGKIGIWVRGEKIAALGVRVTRWVSWHGVAINVCPDLGHFAGIVPCGLRDDGVTSLRALGVEASMADVDAALHDAWGGVFENEIRDADESFGNNPL